MRKSKGNFFTTLPGIILAVIGGVILAAFFGLLFGLLVMFLWNSVITDITGAKQITYLQAFGLIVLCKILIAPTHWRGRGHKTPSKKSKKCSSTDYFGWGKWKYYDEYWKEEGKAAYDEYVKNKEQSDK